MDWAAIVEGVVRGLGGTAIDWWKAWRKDRENEQPAAILDEMLRNPRFRFRKFETLSRTIGDTTPDRELTRRLLRGIGARRNTGEADTWTIDRYWRMNSRTGEWELARGVTPGNI